MPTRGDCDAATGLPPKRGGAWRRTLCSWCRHDLAELYGAVASGIGPDRLGGWQGVHLHTALGVTTAGLVIGIWTSVWARPRRASRLPKRKRAAVDQWHRAAAPCVCGGGDRPLPRLTT